ncbi:hypothetical protein BSKO_07659 [Bryopsis sp. KO-2023]|nr:hypothetical protein BSKO_07659 [Bryopsis sp. KO-2023]
MDSVHARASFGVSPCATFFHNTASKRFGSRAVNVNVCHRRTPQRIPGKTRKYDFCSAPCFTRGRKRHPLKISNVATSESVGVFEELSVGTSRKYIMISGKGGVGKTSLASSLAIKFAEDGHNTLIVSTDPAHSLSDSLNQDVSGGDPVPVEGTVLPLWGMEVDPEDAKDDLRGFASSKAGQKTKDMMENVGIGAEELAGLKLGELLDSPPPGLDEAVALAKVVEFVTKEEYAKFTRIVFDTAPTGHTLRLLSLPDFAGASLAKLIKLRTSLKGATGMIQGLFGNGDEEDQATAIDRLEMLQNRIDLVKLLFQNEKTTEFIIATIPTVLGINESSRLLRSLRKQEIPCKRIIVNQLIGSGAADKYVKLKLKDQERATEILENSPALSKLNRVSAPMLDLEVRGIPALTYFGGMIWRDVFDEMNASPGQRFVLVGGKGGVGKTTSASALAIQYAESGKKTLIVSTDPAHSLSDSLDQDVKGGRPVQVEGTTLPIWGLEINIDEARREMKDAVTGDDGLGKVADDVGLGMFTDQIRDLNLGELLENPPPGTDEAVAIAKVIQILKNEKFSGFQRVVFDTAPTGHTIRLLTLPDFLEKTIGKIVMLRDKIQGAADMVKGVFGGGGKAKTESALKKLERLKENMEEAKALFRDKEKTEFVVVTIPTVMAVSESERLTQALDTEGVPVRTIVVNQVLDPNTTDKFMENRKRDQERGLELLKEDPGLRELQLIKAPLVDLEVRGVPALQYFGAQVWK